MPSAKGKVKTQDPVHSLSYAGIIHSLLVVDDPDKGFVYRLHNKDAENMIVKRAMGWELVPFDTEDGRNLQQKDGTKGIGDLLLCRIPVERFELLQERKKERSRRMERSVKKELEEESKKSGIPMIESAEGR